jgi:threonine/homoserine/homoserine lactone efflux protein
MLSPVVQGAILGLFLSFCVGVTFFVLVETSIQHGFKIAISMSLGVFISDVILLVLIWSLSRQLIESIVENNYFNVFCSLIFTGIGIYYLFNARLVNIKQSNSTYNRKLLFFKGIAVNMSNPSVIIFWLGAMLYASSKLAYNSIELIIYFTSALLVVLLTDLVKIYLASRLKQWVTVKHVRVIYILLGVSLIGIGLRMFITIA